MMLSGQNPRMKVGLVAANLNSIKKSPGRVPGLNSSVITEEEEDQNQKNDKKQAIASAIFSHHGPSLPCRIFFLQYRIFNRDGRCYHKKTRTPGREAGLRRFVPPLAAAIKASGRTPAI
jgi:hypothetical protein